MKCLTSQSYEYFVNLTPKLWQSDEFISFQFSIYYSLRMHW